MTAITNPAVARVFDAYPAAARAALLNIRDLILATAATLEGVGVLEETLKWGEPAYLTSSSTSGSTIRIAWKTKTPGQVGVYFNCKTTLVAHFRALFPSEFAFEGNRAIVLAVSDPIPEQALKVCIAAALTYHPAGRR